MIANLTAARWVRYWRERAEAFRGEGALRLFVFARRMAKHWTARLHVPPALPLEITFAELPRQPIRFTDGDER